MTGGKGILKNTVWVGALTALSRVMGLLREMLQARLIGAGMEQSAFTLAFAIPNMARKLFGEGALTAAFVPVFRGEVEAVGLAKAARLARAVMTTVLLLLGAIVALAVSGLLGAGALADELAFTPRTRLTLSLVTILMPYMLAICAAAFGMGVLNALGRFKASSLMPALLNVFWIVSLGLLVFLPGFSVTMRIRFVASAILVGGFAQMAFMFVCMHRAGVTPALTFSGWGGEKVRLVWRNLGIAALGAGATQINYMLDQVLGQLAAPWAAGVIGYAERLMDLPLGIIGVAFGTVLLPTFSGLFAKGDLAQAREAMATAVKSLLFVMIPAAFGLFVLSGEITAVIYEGGGFDAMATARVSVALAVYALGLGFFGLQKSLVPWFQAQNDMKTPLRVSLVTIALNATLNVLAVFCLPEAWRHVGLASSTVVCAAAGTALLILLAHRRNGDIGLGACTRPIVKMLVSATAMALAICAARPLVESALPAWGEVARRILSLGLLIMLGGLVYGVLALLLMPDIARAALRRRRRR